MRHGATLLIYRLRSNTARLARRDLEEKGNESFRDVVSLRCKVTRESECI